MKVYFIRHGIAEERVFGKDDYSRALTQDGTNKLELIAKKLSNFIHTQKIITSDLLRAKQTATIVQNALGVDLEVDNRINSGANYDDFAQVFSEHASLDSITFVGHEPDISTTVSQIIGQARLEVKKAAIIELEVGEKFKGVLLALVPPRFLL